MARILNKAFPWRPARLSSIPTPSRRPARRSRASRSKTSAN